MERETVRSVDALHHELLKMGSLVEEGLRKALISLSNWDEELAEAVIEEDARIDAMQKQIEDQCTYLIAATQPKGAELRDIICCIKTVTDLERIGDHARHIARSLTKVAGTHYSAMLPQIRSLGDRVLGMVHDSLTALIDRDDERAREVAGRDVSIDETHRGLTAETLNIMKTRAEGIEAGQRIILLSRFLERIGDHVTNICEWIVYARTGDHVEFDR